MNHEKIIQKMDELFKANTLTEEEQRFIKATTVSILGQLRVYEETESQYLDGILTHTFGSVFAILTAGVSSESKVRIKDAVDYFIGELNNEHDEHRQSNSTH